jgi:hypothetical protein
MNQQYNQSRGPLSLKKNGPPRSKRLVSTQPRGQTLNVQVQSRPSVKQRKNSAANMRGMQKQASAAAAYATGQSSQAPSIRATRDSSRIVHRELISSISGTAGFAIANAFALNPGIAATFPWLASQAASWEQYRFNKLRFCYYTRTGSNTPGSMLLVPDYDAADGPPSSEQIASSYEDVSEDAPWKDLCCDLRVSAMHSMGPRKFVRTAALLANQDIKTYDAGNLYACTTDGAVANWGKLWVEYDVSLFVPQLPPAGLPAELAVSQHFPFASNVPTSAAFLGATPTSSGTQLVTAGANNVLTFNQAGNYLLTYNVNATTDTRTGSPAVAAGAAYILSFGITGGNTVAGSGTANFSQMMAVTSPVGGTLTFNNVVVGGAGAELVVTLLSPSQA